MCQVLKTEVGKILRGLTCSTNRARRILCEFVKLFKIIQNLDYLLRMYLIKLRQCKTTRISEYSIMFRAPKARLDMKEHFSHRK